MHADSRAAAAFEAAKLCQPALIAFLRRMPKGADLHHHLDGQTHDVYALQAALAQGRHFDLPTQTFVEKPTPQRTIAADDLRRDDRHFTRFRNAFSMRGWRAAQGSGRDHFFGVFERIQSSGIHCRDMLEELQTRAAYQHIAYVETIAPVVPESALAPLRALLGDAPLRPLQPAFERLAPALRGSEWAHAVRQHLNTWETTPADGQRPVCVRYIAYVLRHLPLHEFFLQAAAALAAMQCDERVVGLNVVGAEDSPLAVEQNEEQLAVLHFLWQHMGQPAIALHAGEATPADLPPEHLRRRIRQAVNLGHARRIGHGVSVAWEEDVYGLLAQMAQQGVAVEICLSSNEVILGVKGHEHPFELYRQHGVPLVLATDDEGITRSPLTLEFVKAVERYRLSYADVLDLVRNSLAHAFLPGQSLFLQGPWAQPAARICATRARAIAAERGAACLDAAAPQIGSPGATGARHPGL